MSPRSSAGTGDEFEVDEWDLIPEADHLGSFVKGQVATPPAVEAPAAAPAATEPPADSAPADALSIDVADDADSSGEPILGYLHLQFCVARGPPLLCVLNMQLAPKVTGKGLGKFALQLVELMALQNGTPRPKIQRLLTNPLSDLFPSTRPPPNSPHPTR